MMLPSSSPVPATLPPESRLLANLNPEQLAAVTLPAEPALAAAFGVSVGTLRVKLGRLS